MSSYLIPNENIGRPLLDKPLEVHRAKCGDVIYFTDDTFRWLTRIERFLLWLKLTTIEKINEKWLKTRKADRLKYA